MEYEDLKHTNADLQNWNQVQYPIFEWTTLSPDCQQ